MIWTNMTLHQDISASLCNTLDKVLLDFTQNPLEYDLGELIREDEVKDMEKQVETSRKELYKISTSEMVTERK